PRHALSLAAAPARSVRVAHSLTLVRSAGSALFYGRTSLPLDFPPLDRLALVVRLLAPGEGESQLDAAVLEVHPDRHERHPALDGLPDQFPDLLAVQQQLAPPRGVVIAVAAIAVRVDVNVVDPHLAVLDAREAVAQVRPAFADRLDLRTQQRD